MQARERLAFPIEPMEARSVKEIPKSGEWLYEPKWDGFRCIAFRDGDTVTLQSKAGQPLDRYFPELVSAVAALNAKNFVLDGEIFVERNGRLDFDALLQRIHPAASRVQRLARETSAAYAVFDLLSSSDDDAVFAKPLAERRKLLEAFAERQFSGRIALSPATNDRDRALEWFEGGNAWFDGVVAKRLDADYRFGERDAVVKIKRDYTADCVVGGFRYGKDGRTVASLLLGLYDAGGLLHHVGFLSSLNADERARAKALIEPLVEEPGFTGSRPGGSSRWGTRDTEWHPLRPQLVVEVGFDRVTGRRFRHGTRFVRWRPDKSPQQCSIIQLERWA